MILVTGAGGFIGSHVAEALLRRGDAVLGLDDLNPFYPLHHKHRNLALLASFPRFRFLKGDIADTATVERAFSDYPIERVAHLAARAGVRPSLEDPQTYQRANVLGSLNVIQAAARHAVEQCVVTSSSSVYGLSRELPFNESRTPTDSPVSPYAATKKAAELLAHSFHQTHGLSVTIVRPFTVYGPRGRPDMAPWRMVEAMVRRQPFPRYGDGSAVRDFTYIDDFVRGFVAALDRPMGFRIFNLGSGVPGRLAEALRITEQVGGEPLRIVPLANQSGDMDATLADISQAGKALGYAPQVGFEEGMRQFFAWYVSGASGEVLRPTRGLEVPAAQVAAS